MIRTPNNKKVIRMADFSVEYRELNKAIDHAIKNVLTHGWYILGNEVKGFESEFAGYIGAKYGVGVNSGTDAILISLMALGVKGGDEIITVSHTTTPTVMPISILGATPVFVDIDPGTYTIAVEQIESKITKKTKAILPVHIYGNPANMDTIMDIAKRYGIYVVEDACQAHGAEYKGKKVGTFGACSAFSFYPTKNLGGYGDGGMILTNDEAVYGKLIMIRQYGWKTRYDSRIVGINSRLDEIQAAVLRIKLRYLDKWNGKRRSLADLYMRNLSGSGIGLPVEQKNGVHVYHQFVIRCKDRDRLQKYLIRHNIETQIHYPTPVHMQKTYRRFKMNGRLPVTENACDEILSLPVSPHLNKAMIDRTSAAIRGYVS